MITAVLILNYNNVEDTINCIESVQCHNTANIRYYVVDNGSNRKDSVSKLSDFLQRTFRNDYLYLKDGGQITDFKKAILIHSDTNDGYAQGNNKGLKYIYQDNEVDCVLVLNNDVLFIEDVIPSLRNNMNNLPKCGLISPLLYHKNMQGIDYNCARLNHSKTGLLLIHLLLKRNIFNYEQKETYSRQILKKYPDYLNLPYVEIEMPSGSCMLFKKSLFQKIGGFDPSTFLYYEENILHKKTQREGLINYLIPSLKCIHLGGMSTQKSPSAFIKIKSLESALYYAENYAGYNRIQKVLFRSIIYFMRFIIKYKSYR